MRGERDKLWKSKHFQRMQDRKAESQRDCDPLNQALEHTHTHLHVTLNFAPVQNKYFPNSFQE